MAWYLSTFFILKKKLALPGIVLLFSFVGTVTAYSFLTIEAYTKSEDISGALALGIGAMAAWVHWIKFRVPITVAAGVGSLILCILSFLAQYELVKTYIHVFAIAGGIVTFLTAMLWDTQDPERITRKSDVAFWLHLLAAPLLVHPIFASLGLLNGEATSLSIAFVIFMYFVLAAISISIDRRALMVSSLIYVLYAFNELFVSFGMISSGLAISGVLISSALLLLSIFWQQSRIKILKHIPQSIALKLPPAG